MDHTIVMKRPIKMNKMTQNTERRSMLPPPYIFPPLGGAVYWLAGGPWLSSSAPPQQNIFQVLSAAISITHAMQLATVNFQ